MKLTTKILNEIKINDLLRENQRECHLGSILEGATALLIYKLPIQHVILQEIAAILQLFFNIYIILQQYCNCCAILL